METTTQSITVRAPLRSVYNQWTQFEEFPQFMQGIRDVEQIDDTTLRWTADIAGKEASWTARVTEQVPDQLIAWQSTSGRSNNGRVSFRALGGNETEITLSMEYEPEGIIENVGDALGIVERRVEGDLERFRAFIERRGLETGGWRGTVHQGQEVSSGSGVGSGSTSDSGVGTDGSGAALTSGDPLRR
jgi:uncharacterized membrane protein